MELTTALKEDSYTREEALLYLELIKGFIEQFQGDCPSLHDYLCIKAINSGSTALTDASNAFSNAINILNQDTAPRKTLLELPNNWKKPKFALGQLTKQGLIVGMRYNPNPDYEEWNYYVQDGTELHFVEVKQAVTEALDATDFER